MDFNLSRRKRELTIAKEIADAFLQATNAAELASPDKLVHHPRWANLGLGWLAAFDKIELSKLRQTAKSANVRPLKAGIATLFCVELEKILGPSVLPKPPKPVRAKTEPKPPRSLTRIPGTEKNIRLGLELLTLRSNIKNNVARQVRRQFNVDGPHACETMKVARLYGGKPEIFTRLSWIALLHLASPTLPAAALEARICAGERASARPRSVQPAERSGPASGGA